jgi:uncharacterized protein (UPF0333 family)
VSALNVSISTTANVTANVTMSYPCAMSASSVLPFIYVNGTWKAITPFSVNAAKCTVSFALPKDPIVALFSNALPVTTTVAATVPQTTAVTTIPQQASAQNGTYAVAAVVIVVVVVLAVAYYAVRARQRRRAVQARRSR